MSEVRTEIVIDGPVKRLWPICADVGKSGCLSCGCRFGNCL